MAYEMHHIHPIKGAFLEMEIQFTFGGNGTDGGPMIVGADFVEDRGYADRRPGADDRG